MRIGGAVRHTQFDGRVEYARRRESLNVLIAESISDDGRYPQFHSVQIRRNHPLQLAHRVLEFVHSFELIPINQLLSYLSRINQSFVIGRIIIIIRLVIGWTRLASSISNI